MRPYQAIRQQIPVKLTLAYFLGQQKAYKSKKTRAIV